jgi:hypothetical protein
MSHFEVAAIGTAVPIGKAVHAVRPSEFVNPPNRRSTRRDRPTCGLNPA